MFKPRTYQLLSLAVFGLSSLLTVPSLARAGDLDFTLKNRLGVTITHLYLSPHQDDNWGGDVLKLGVLADNRSTNISFSAAEARRGDLWDIKIKTADGSVYFWQQPGFNLRQISEITIILQGGKVTAVSK